MQNKLIPILLKTTAALFVVGLTIFLIWGPKRGATAKSDGRDAPITEETVDRTALSNPPPVPKAVKNPDRVRQNLQPGKTYLTHAKGTLKVRATDKDWGIEEVITLNYVFEAKIDREIESNDGTTIVELRHFRDVRSLKVETKLEDVRIDLGPATDTVLLGLAFFQPEAAGMIKAVDGTSLKSILGALRVLGASPDRLIQEQAVKAFSAVDRLTGKSVRITYLDGKGVLGVTRVKGEMTAAERDFHFCSVLLSDSLIIPDVDIKVGTPWRVDGSNFANLIDPSLLARVSGEVSLTRDADEIIRSKTCAHVKVAGGRLTIDESDPKVGRIGHFDPEGSMFFSRDDQIIIQAELRGKAQLDQFSKDHLLFESRMRQTPELHVLYDCQVVDTLQRNRP